MHLAEGFQLAEHVTQAGEAGSVGLKHLLVIAGPSGGGKTTFITQLVSAQLPDQVRAQLPYGAEEWAELSAGGYKRWLPTIIERSTKK